MFFDEIQAAPTLPALILGLYEQAIPAVMRALRRWLDETNRLFDHPGYRLCRLILFEMEDVNRYGQEVVRCLVETIDREPLSSWLDTLRRILNSGGDLDGAARPVEESFDRVFSGQPWHYSAIPQRDPRFKDPYNMGVNAEELLFNPDIAPLPKSVMLYFKRMREIDVPEVISSILSEQPGRSWDYYRDMTRQLWDEARHAMMASLALFRWASTGATFL
jgi:hypothetical protein